jgi:hypothetical protein
MKYLYFNDETLFLVAKQPMADLEDRGMTSVIVDDDFDHGVDLGEVDDNGEPMQRDKTKAEALAAIPYDMKRRQAYPNIGDQLDDLFKSGAFSDEMAAQIQAVKDANPKP